MNETYKLETLLAVECAECIQYGLCTADGVSSLPSQCVPALSALLTVTLAYVATSGPVPSGRDWLADRMPFPLTMSRMSRTLLP